MIIIIAILSLEPSTGFIDDGFASLTCEISGYANSSSSPMWATDTSVDFDPCKFVVNVSSSNSNSLIYSNGSVGPAVVSTLTIKELQAEDAGSYTCSFEGRALVSQLTVLSSRKSKSVGQLTALCCSVIYCNLCDRTGSRTLLPIF